MVLRWTALSPRWRIPTWLSKRQRKAASGGRAKKPRPAPAGLGFSESYLVGHLEGLRKAPRRADSAVGAKFLLALHGG